MILRQDAQINLQSIKIHQYSLKMNLNYMPKQLASDLLLKMMRLNLHPLDGIYESNAIYFSQNCLIDPVIARQFLTTDFLFLVVSSQLMHLLL
mmetsp:Transcript_3906/g.5386  ORF Transcript_3906/g.5386 Transcript_3906/m.5386 type:complete len:93 (+) Transcript_3906:1909-2187(+)